MITESWQYISDWLRERRIDRLRRELIEAQGDEVVMAYARLADEIRKRSPGQVRRMEIARGLV